MSNPACANGNLNDVNYSSPVPVIGLYIAAASLGCLLLIAYDVIVAGILPRKHWLPCKLFTLNSVTLTLLSIAAKLTVDLTTPMPSRWDQLSKLTGTAFICIGMGFLVPSIGVNAESECFTNMMALTIFVITVTVNICIQLSTGVIFMFFVEHVIIMGLMLLLLLMMWRISLSMKYEKRIDAGRCTSLITRGSSSMFERLKLCSIHAYCSNPQFKISMYPLNITVGCICVVCAAIIVAATLRSLVLDKLEFCGGVSDYRWSMQYLVIIQIVTVALGSIPTAVRGVTMFTRMDLEAVLEPFVPDGEHQKQMNQTLRAKGVTLHRLVNLVGSLITVIVSTAQLLTVYPLLLASNYFQIYQEDNQLEYFGEDFIARGYAVRKSIDEMIRLKDKASSSEVQYQPSLYLCRKCPSPYLSPSRMQIKNGNHQIEINTLSMVLLVKIAEASVPKQFLVSLLKVFHEAKEVIDYIDKAIISNNTIPRHDSDSEGTTQEATHQDAIEKSIYASDMWMGGDLKCHLPDNVQPSADHTVAIETLRKLKEILRSGDVWNELRLLVDFINHRSYLSIEDLCGTIEELFADMLHAFFAQLPRAIFHNLNKTRGEEFEKSVRVAMKFLFQIGSLECEQGWTFPANTDTFTIINDNHLIQQYRGAFQRLENVVLVHREYD